MDPEGNSYERTAIEQWLAKQRTSPVTRTILGPMDLAPNRALKDVIDAELAKAGGGAVAVPAPVPVPAQPAASAAEMAADRSVGLGLTAARSPRGPADEVMVMATVVPPVGVVRTPSDVCCVVDVSGSMGAEATMQNAAGGLEAHGLSLLDVVKHAVTTVISVLEPTDRLSVVAYSSEARVVFDLISMDETGKARAKRDLTNLYTGGQTNLWDGLHSGLEVLRRGTEDGSNRLSAVLLLTDGQPNVIPPRGHLPMLERYKDQNLRLSATISTFGFGYRLDSELLRELAVQGDGMYAFIPDSGFVGTAFVNAASNLLVTMGNNAEIALEPAPGVAIIEGGVPGGVPVQTTSWGAQLSIGSLQYGQKRSFIARVKVPPGFAPGMPFLTATLRYHLRHDTEPVATGVDAIWSEAALVNTPEITQERLRLTMVDGIAEAIGLAKCGDLPGAQAVVAQLVTELQSVQPRSASIDAMQADVVGQMTEAMSREDWYTKWGGHYLPSLGRAHQLQQCNNFKDPGIQQYGGDLFKALRDHADDLFCKLPPPKPSAGAAYSYRPRSAAGGAAGGAAAASPVPAPAPRPPIDMSMYNNRSNPCFAGECLVTMADGSKQPVVSIACGQLVQCGGSTTARVRCVVKTHCAQGRCELAELPGGLLVTPWHPVRDADGEWQFPASLAPSTERDCVAVYSFVLDAEHAMVIDGVECVTLGHNFSGDVVGHPYFGSAAVLTDLARFAGWEKGLVELHPGCLMRDSDTQLLGEFDLGREIVCAVGA